MKQFLDTWGITIFTAIIGVVTVAALVAAVNTATMR